MATSLVSTGVQFPDNSVQTTAATTDIPSGSVMLFAQTAAPTGWTKNTSSGNNHALRVVTGNAGTGGSVDFTTAFSSQSVSGTVSVSASTGQTAAPVSVGNHTLSTPQIPAHSHLQRGRVPGGPNIPNRVTTPRVGPSGNLGRGPIVNTNPPTTTANSGGGGAHSHPASGGQHAHPVSASGTFSGNAINLAVRYVDVIRATKN